MEKLDVKKFLELQKNYPLIDVRSPAEFAEGHVPQATNLAIFDNDERALVGTLYKKSGKDTAVIKGLELVGPKLAYFAKKAKKLAVDKTILVHCWRGGMRSASMAWLFETIGLKVYVLEGGYKAYRTFIRQSFTESDTINILSGKTGSGKTEILEQFKQLGEQVLNLEFMANHKGSAFGAIGERKQPTTEQFENNLYQIWETLDMKSRIWIEDESVSIGRVIIPNTLFTEMRKAEVVMIHVPHKQRINRLVEMYGQAKEGELVESVNKIKKRLGGQHTIDAVEAIENGRLDKAVDIILRYYDKTYATGLERRDPTTVRYIDIPDLSQEKTARFLLDIL